MHANHAAEPLAVETANTRHEPATTAHHDHSPAATRGGANHVGSGTENGPHTSWVVLALALAAQILVVLDISVVNTALPSIGRDLQLDGSQMQWVVTAYR